jgi:WD40 repeat protein
VLVTPNRSHAIGLSPDGHQLIAVFTNGTFVVWDTRHFSPSPTFSLPTKDVVQLALAPGGKLAAFAFDLGSNRVDYVIWDVERNQPKFVALQGTARMSGRIRFSEDGRKMALGAMSHLDVFDVASGRQTHQLPYEQNNEPDLVGGLAFSRDARWVTAVTHLGWVHVWDLQATESKRVFRPGKSVMSDAVFSRDARILVVASTSGTFAFDLQRGEQLPSLNPKPSHAKATALSPDGKTLALAENDTITLWNIESRQLVGKLSGHQRELRDLAFTPDGKILVSAAFDEYRLWRIGETGITNQNNDQP